MTVDDRSELAKARHEGTVQRAACVDALADLFTDPAGPFSTDVMRESKSVLFYLAPEVRPMFEAICNRYSEPREREVLRGILLATALECVNLLLD
jgi:hypothetical protein